MATQRSTFAFVSGLILSATLAAILALLPAGSIAWLPLTVVVAVPALLVVVLTVSVVGMVIGQPHKLLPYLRH